MNEPGGSCGNIEDIEGLLVELFRGFEWCFVLTIRRPALGWPLAVSQEEHLSYCVGSPLALGGLDISLCEDCLSISTSLYVAG